VRSFTVVAALLAAACSGDGPFGGGGDAGSGGAKRPLGFQLSCDLATDYIFDGGVPRDAIPALVNPPLVSPEDPAVAYIEEYEDFRVPFPELPESRVVGLVVDGQAVAFPHNVLWWHEIVNIDLGRRRLAITYCPLTGSALVFDGTSAGTQRFGVSGLLYLNNLMMFDRETESLWPQMLRGSRCGPRSGAALVTVPHIEMRWDAWLALHPNTLVVSSETGFTRSYNRYPYDLYEASDGTLFPIGDFRDRRRRTKERVLGIPGPKGGLALPFGELEAAGGVAVIPERVGDRDVLVLWDRVAQAAQAYEPVTTDGNPVTLAVENGRLVDGETSSVWSVEGVAIEGDRTGERLVPIDDSFVAFWFAWAAFNRGTRIWVN
jgi:hypothetical protein